MPLTESDNDFNNSFVISLTAKAESWRKKKGA